MGKSSTPPTYDQLFDIVEKANPLVHANGRLFTYTLDIAGLRKGYFGVVGEIRRLMNEAGFRIDGSGHPITPTRSQENENKSQG